MSSKDTLNSIVSEKFEGIVWKLVPDAVLNLLFIETRNTDKKEVFFSCFDLNKQVFLWKNIQTEEKWYTGIETAYKGILLLHGYSHPGSPERKSIIAINYKDAEVSWQKYNDIFYQLHPEGLIVYNAKIEPRRYRLIDAQTGNEILQNSLIDKGYTIERKDIQFPINDSEKIITFNWNNEEINLHHSELLNLGPKQIIAGFSTKGDILIQHLIILENDVPVYYDLISEDAKGFVMESLFMIGNTLLYIKNKQEFKAVLV